MNFLFPLPYTPLYYFWRGATAVCAIDYLLLHERGSSWWFWLIVLLLCVTPPYRKTAA